MLSQAYAVHAGSRDGLGTAIGVFVLIAVFWTGLFYALALAFPRLQQRMGRSSKEHENDRYWCARNITGTIHAIVVSAMVLPCFFVFNGAPGQVRFAYAPDHIGWCDSPELEQAGFDAWVFPCQVTALAGTTFAAFTFADVFISGVHGMATVDYMVHHFAFLSAAFIIRGNCMVPFNAAALLAMEVSTPFLNTLLLLRNRGDAYSKYVPVLGIIFMVLYVLFRLVVSVYAVVVLFLHRNSAFPQSMPVWQAWFLSAAIFAGTAVQFFWFPKIAKTFGSGLVELLQSSDVGKRESHQLPGDEPIRELG
uniref:TLC domain-containing protein n=1 Tax=Strombidinopsis acuminata TaxID=141414 RepID=A0A7S3TWE2_9SPIT|mmetsp:Transcript_100281/g.259047  ORF Transcript_100281/g.259047 Transcript_100281/m.259047 type:complete len:307 (+) Transcript_100281:46-966(+)